MPERLFCPSLPLWQQGRGESGDNRLGSITRQFFFLLYRQQKQIRRRPELERRRREIHRLPFGFREMLTAPAMFILNPHFTAGWESEVCGQGRVRTAPAASLPGLVQERLPWVLWLTWGQLKGGRVLPSVSRVYVCAKSAWLGLRLVTQGGLKRLRYLSSFSETGTSCEGIWLVQQFRLSKMWERLGSSEKHLHKFSINTLTLECFPSMRYLAVTKTTIRKHIPICLFSYSS